MSSILFHPEPITMSTSSVFGAGAAAFVLALGCSGDLTLPASGEPSVLVVVSGDGQRAEAGALLEEPLMVQLLDGSALPVRDTPVQFSFVGDLPGAGLSPATVRTDQQGRAAAIVRLGDVVGDQVIVAVVASTEWSDLRARFVAVAVAPDDGGGGDGGGKKGKPGKGDRGSPGDDDSDDDD
jgi:hypothetical protein